MNSVGATQGGEKTRLAVAESTDGVDVIGTRARLEQGRPWFMSVFRHPCSAAHAAYQYGPTGSGKLVWYTNPCPEHGSEGGSGSPIFTTACSVGSR
jgi:hypothetical protein